MPPFKEFAEVTFWILGSLVGVAFLAFFVLRAYIMIADLRTGREAQNQASGRRRLSETLRPLQTFFIASWYIMHLLGAIMIGLVLWEGSPPKDASATQANLVSTNLVSTNLASQTSQQPKPIEEDFWARKLRLIKQSSTSYTIAGCFIWGCIGATAYGVHKLVFSKDPLDKQWLLRRHMLLPILGSFLGAISYLFVKVGMFTFKAAGSGGNAALADESDRGNFLVYGIAVLAGLASRVLMARLMKIAEHVFAATPNEDG